LLPFILITAAAVAILLLAEAREQRSIAGVAKGVASSAFIAAALVSHATVTPYGRALLVALALSWLGDLLLLSREQRPVLAGLGAFLAAHLAYAAAFLLAGVAWRAVGLALLPLAAFAAIVSRWLLPHVEAPMRRPVIAYMAALTVMVALAAGAAFHGGAGPGHLLATSAAAPLGIPLVLAAAVAFLLSDLAVARDRFVRPGLANEVWGLPLYYGAQLAFAATAAFALPAVSLLG
jgi:uncharacterized membrane protein YhhN